MVRRHPHTVKIGVRFSSSPYYSEDYFSTPLFIYLSLHKINVEAKDKLKRLDRDVAALLEKIKSRKMPQGNWRAINSWVDFLRANGSHQKTIVKNLYCFICFLDTFPPKISLSKATKEEIGSAMAKIENSDYASTTKRNIKVIVKSFYKHYLGDDLYYPKQIAWVKSSNNRNKKMLPEDILSEEEILKMIGSASNIRDKAIIALLYDSGIRVGELLSLRKKDVDMDSEPAHVIVDGKTGMRKIPIWFSVPYLTNYLELVKEKKQDSYLWTGVGTWSASITQVDGSAIRKVLRLAAAKAGIEKRIYPHLFRHSRATYYANKLTEQQLKAFFGWTGDSRMVSTYVHMSGRDIDDAVMQAYGKKAKETTAPKLTEKVCPRCRYPNGIDFLHCRRCGAPLNESQAMKGEVTTKTLNEALLEHATDPGFVESLIDYIAKQEKNRKKR